MFYVSSRLDGALSLKGRAILFAYFLVSSLGRVSALLLFLTPVLGLFGCLTVSAFGSVHASKNAVFDYVPGSNGSFVSLEDGWADFRLGSKSDLVDTAAMSIVMPCLPALIALFHGVGVACIRNRSLGSVGLDWRDVYSVVCPPLFHDWMQVLSADDGGCKSIPAAWSKSRRAFLQFVGLFAVENLLLLAPIYIMKRTICQRVAAMSPVFPLLPEEERSVALVDALFYGGGVTLGALLPTLQLSIATLYFGYGHPWARLLNSLTSK